MLLRFTTATQDVYGGLSSAELIPIPVNPTNTADNRLKMIC